MAAWSRVLRPATELFLRPKQKLANLIPKNGTRCMSDERRMVVMPGNFQWHKTKDLFHFYFMLGVIPWAIVITYVNVFIGPATLEEIPEGYEPKVWEYDEHPISRFIMKYVMNSPQQEYEKNLAHLYLENHARKLRRLDKLVDKAMSDYQDYQAFYFRHFFNAKYIYDYRMQAEKRYGLSPTYLWQQ